VRTLAPEVRAYIASLQTQVEASDGKVREAAKKVEASEEKVREAAKKVEASEEKAREAAKKAREAAKKARKAEEKARTERSARLATITKTTPTSHAQAVTEIKKDCGGTFKKTDAGTFFRAYPEVDEARVSTSWTSLESCQQNCPEARLQEFMHEKILPVAAPDRVRMRELPVPSDMGVTRGCNKVDHATLLLSDSAIEDAKQRLSVALTVGELKTKSITAAFNQAVTYTHRRYVHALKALDVDSEDTRLGFIADCPLRKVAWATNMQKIQFICVQTRRTVAGSTFFEVIHTEPMDFLPHPKPAVPTTGWACFLRLHAAPPRTLGVIRVPVREDSEELLDDARVNVQVLGRIALGGWSDVYRGSMKKRTSAPSTTVAVKVAGSVGNCHLQEEYDTLKMIVDPTVVELPVLLGKVTKDDKVQWLVTQPLGKSIWTAPSGVAVFRRIAQGVLKALRAAHSKGVVHLDIRPDNLVWVRGGNATSGHVLVVDWGAAKLVGADIAGLVGVAAFAHDDILRHSHFGDADFSFPVGIDGLSAAAYNPRPQFDLASLAYTLAALRGRHTSPPWVLKPSKRGKLPSTDAYISARKLWMSKNASKEELDLLAAAGHDELSAHAYNIFN